MNIYDLEKQATPAPWRVSGECSDFQGNAIYAKRGADTAKLVWWGGRRNVPQAEQEANEAVLAHCRNNFVRAVKALKSEHEDYERLCEQDGYEHVPEVCETCALIKKLEEVEE